MVLQRWQTVLLFIAFALIVLFLATPMGYNAAGYSVFALAVIPFFILNVVIALLLFIEIFLYRNLKVQIKWSAVILVLEAASAGLAFGMVYFTEGFKMSLMGAPLVVAALVLTWFARRFMIKDKKLLAAADRIR